MNKKSYIKPLIELIHIDNQISVIMATDPPIGPGQPEGPLSIKQNSSPFPASTPPSQGYGSSSPFGGSTPDYQ